MSLFTSVEMAPRDPILGLNEQFNADTRPHKVNLGVGVYYDENGKLPLLQCVQAAEKAMMQAPKARGFPGGPNRRTRSPVRAWRLRNTRGGAPFCPTARSTRPSPSKSAAAAPRCSP